MWSESVPWPSIPSWGRRRWWIAAVGAGVAMPFCYYLMLVGVFGVGPLLVLANFAVVIELRRQKYRRAALLVGLFVGVAGLLGLVVWW